MLRWFAEGGPLVRAVRGNHEEAALSNYRSMRCVLVPLSSSHAYGMHLFARCGWAGPWRCPTASASSEAGLAALGSWFCSDNAGAL